MTREQSSDDANRIEPWLNDCTQGNLIGLGIENVPSSYRGLFATFLIMASLVVGFFTVLRYWP